MPIKEGDTAPAFGLRDTGGRRYAYPEDAQGQPLLLVFFKTTCETCDLAFPYLQRLREAYPTGWSIWAIAQDQPGPAAAYAQRHGLNFPVLIDDPSFEASILYDPPATPTIVLVEGGRVVYAAHGFAKDDINELARRVARYSGAEPTVIASADDGQPAFRPG